MSVKSMLLRLARAVVQSVIAQLLKQLSVTEDQVLNPVKAMIQAVVGGIWRGEGANAFVDELTSILIPDIENIIGKISKTSNDLSHGVEVIDSADETVDRMVHSRLTDAFNFY